MSGTRGALSRRAVVIGLGAGLAGIGRAQAEPQELQIDQLKPGQFSWHPERAPGGPIAIVVSLPDQRVYVYRNGVRIAVSTCSTGKKGHETPTGVFTILEKDKDHHSSIYNNAPMPNMNRLTWSGVALHAGNLPGYPASHGCVRLPMAFSQKLFGITRIGTPVIIADAATYPTAVIHPGMVLSADAAKAFDGVAAAAKKQAAKPVPANQIPATSIMVSSADQRIIILDDGKQVAEGAVTITNPDKPLGNHVFILSSVDTDDKELRWQTIGYYDNDQRSPEPMELVTIQRIRTTQAVVDAMTARMHPGTVMVTVDVPLSADTRTGKDFVIITNDAGS
ncbi:L,D-transpeptidase [Starkeya sp. ORNL1]|uniref:L,D-transpeptidase n=1 Tax=Starkeya sp. ORNL1 TaxID=2709380 RepID=UPI0014634D69|nr:L,D-transpeptidase [Starkeya sp. ORNL1]QJP13626.1 L,D-transpeptidase [Starkeya sp. ORNL1]